MPFFFFLLLKLPVVIVESLETLAFSFLPEVGKTALGDFSVDLFADCVNLGPKRALFHHFFLFLLFLPQQGRMLFFGPSIPLLDDVFLSQFLAYFLADAIDFWLILLILHQIVLSKRVFLVLMVILQDLIRSFLIALPQFAVTRDAAGGVRIVFA